MPTGATPTLLPALAPLAAMFDGPLAPWRDALIGHDDPQPAMPLTQLLSQENFDACLARFATGYGTHDAGSALDRRALASEWSKQYFSRLLPPVLAAAMLLDLSLPLTLNDMAIRLDDRGGPLAFKLPPGASCPRPAQAGACLAPLVDGHLAPLIETLARHTRLSPRVFWSNAGNLIEWMLTAVAAFPAVPPGDVRTGARLDDAMAMLHARHRPDGRPNPLYLPVRYLPVRILPAGELDAPPDAPPDAGAHPAARDALHASPWRQRRVCCVRYLLPGAELCTNCPLLDAPPARDQLT